MKVYFSSIATFLLIQITFGQKTTATKPKIRHATEKEQEFNDRSNDCIKHTTRSFTERLKNYPFNIAAQIQLVSFKHNTADDKFDGYKDSLPRNNDTICYSKLNEIRNLTYTQVDKLTDVLYNYGYRREINDTNLIYTDISLQCYNPRNAILFLDSLGKVFEFIEICFECDKTKESSDKVNLGVSCNQKLGLIKRFFIEIGVDYGTKNYD